MIEKSVAFTGHRPDKLPFRVDIPSEYVKKVTAVLCDEIRFLCHAGYTVFYCGMAMGADLLFAEAVLEVKKDFPRIRLCAALPFPGQSASWSEGWKQRYQALLSAADTSIALSGTYTRDCFLSRDRYMVDHAQVVIALYNGQNSGGTAYTVRYARKQGREVIVIEPKTLQRQCSFLPL